jgi:Abnormal spindle-like microcephaly-assoc'd, ASPM-SPD-2-Hydin
MLRRVSSPARSCAHVRALLSMVLLLFVIRGLSGCAGIVSSAASQAKPAASPAALTITPSSATFGNVTVGTSNSQPIQLSNSGGVALTITQISATGSGFSTGTVAVPISLNPGQSTVFNVQFSPSAVGSASGSVTVTSDAPNSPATISLSGSGVQAVAHSVALNWLASPSSTATGYNVYRSEISGSGYIRINSSVLSSLAYTDRAVLGAQTYYYVATAVDANGDESVYSNELQISVP